MKLNPRAVKVYKPESLICPKCGGALKYTYTVSNKVVQFTSGKVIRIKNMGYKCISCNSDNVYFSQTANKLCFKGYTYSMKLLCLIDYYKNSGISREKICDIFDDSNIIISSRNIDNLYNKIKELEAINKIEESFERQLKEFNQIRLSIDFIAIESKITYTIVYDYFSGDILYLYRTDSTNEELVVKPLEKYLSNPNISMICTIRPIFKLVSRIKQFTNKKCKYVYFNKF